MGASFDGEGTVRCVSPTARRAGYVAVMLVQGDAVLPVSLSFEYHADMVVERVEPSVGLLAGGTIVTVTGSGFSESVEHVVRVGRREVVLAKVLSPTMLECTTPSQLHPGHLPIEVSRNRQDFTRDEVLLEYQALARLDEIAPSRGPSCGGTLVAIAGEGVKKPKPPAKGGKKDDGDDDDPYQRRTRTVESDEDHTLGAFGGYSSL